MLFRRRARVRLYHIYHVFLCTVYQFSYTTFTNPSVSHYYHGQKAQPEHRRKVLIKGNIRGNWKQEPLIVTENPEKGHTSQTCFRWPGIRPVMPEACRLVLPFSLGAKTVCVDATEMSHRLLCLDRGPSIYIFDSQTVGDGRW
jgi:hypothetical protein